MPKVIITWEWEEAFSKFGFGDGDGWNGTHEVEGEIESLGYEVEADSWGCHNYMIFDIKKDGKSVYAGDDLSIGYDDARNYLPNDIINHLDKEFPDD